MSSHASTPAHIHIQENNKYQMHSAGIWVLPTLRSDPLGPHTHACLQPNNVESGLEQGALEKKKSSAKTKGASSLSHLTPP